MSKKSVAFSKPKTADDWVGAGKERLAVTGPMKRFTFDVPLDLHTRVKSQCAARGTNMADLIRGFLEKEFPATKA